MTPDRTRRNISDLERAVQELLTANNDTPVVNATTSTEKVAISHKRRPENAVGHGVKVALTFARQTLVQDSVKVVCDILSRAGLTVRGIESESPAGDRLVVGVVAVSWDAHQFEPLRAEVFETYHDLVPVSRLTSEESTDTASTTP